MLGLSSAIDTELHFVAIHVINKKIAAARTKWCVIEIPRFSSESEQAITNEGRSFEERPSKNGELGQGLFTSLSSRHRIACQLRSN